MIKLKLSEVVFRKDLYPRIEHNQSKVQEYAENIAYLPPIEINQKNELIDGFHRFTAHKLANQKEISATVTETRNDNHLLELAIERNNAHGLQMSLFDKKRIGTRLYRESNMEDRGAMKDRLPKLLSINPSTFYAWIADIDSDQIRERNDAILRQYLRCYEQQEIGAKVGLKNARISQLISVFLNLEKVKTLSVNEEKEHPVSMEMVCSANFNDFQPPIYNVWAFGKKTNEVEHFGNTEQRIVDNLLWLYTNPFDIVFDPFGGGGSTLDICERRLRRCWIADRKPKPGMEDKLRTHDICDGLPSLPWSEVSLVYLDPPYWRQAQGQYSDDPEDLANMPIEEFTSKLSNVVKRIATKLSESEGKNQVIALIIQPTQWKSETKGEFTDHVFDLINAVGNKKVKVENRISCPYSTEQCTPQMVDWAKENKKPLVLSRELIIWRVQ